LTARLIDGRAAAAALRQRVATQVAAFRAATGRPPGLATVLVGEDPASAVYVRSKGKATVEAGMESFSRTLPADTSQAELLALIAGLNADPAVDGILVQLPLPPHIDANAIILAIDPDKDVDGFHPINAGRLAIGLPGFVACTPLGCLMLLKDTLGELAGLHAVVVGRSNIVGKPMAQLLLRESCTVSIVHSRTHDLPSITRQADILVAAIGQPRMILGDWIKPGATVVDVGINRTDEGLVGDVDFAGASKVASAISPVPGGVGPMTIACLIRNSFVSAARRENFDYGDAL
jgi:methylenetetrahydrofolate dehydrogenase (NADP+)/methenyltetrahydrofolate cyclohydrolase